MDKPRLLDLFSGAGGAAKGYQNAGFYVVGVDHKPQKNYCGDEFIQTDALEYLAIQGKGYDAVHASPPCQAFTRYKNVHKDLPDRYPNLIDPIRKILIELGKPYVIENVQGAPLADYCIMLCGSSFGLPIRRHRFFETNFFALSPPCEHYWQKPQYPSSTGRKPMSRRTMEIGSWDIPLAQQKEGMDIDWMNLEELSEAIPPAYTQWIGERLLEFPEGESNNAQNAL